MGRRRLSTPFSLFSFQDIITSVTGIIILLTLMLALELITRQRRATADTPTVEQPQSAQVRELEAQIEAAEAQAKLLEQQLQTDQQLLQRLAEETPEELQRTAQAAAGEIRRLEAELRELDAEVSKKQAEEKMAKAQAAAIAEQQAERVNELESRRQAAVEKLKEVKAKNRLVFNPTKGAEKTPWIVEIRADKILVAKAGEAAPTAIYEQSSASARTREMLRFARSRNSSSDYFVLLLKPGGKEAFEELRESLGALGFDVGFDLIGKDQTVVDDAKEAEAP